MRVRVRVRVRAGRRRVGEGGATRWRGRVCGPQKGHRRRLPMGPVMIVLDAMRVCACGCKECMRMRCVGVCGCDARCVCGCDASVYADAMRGVYADADAKCAHVDGKDLQMTWRTWPSMPARNCAPGEAQSSAMGSPVNGSAPEKTRTGSKSVRTFWPHICKMHMLSWSKRSSGARLPIDP